MSALRPETTRALHLLHLMLRRAKPLTLRELQEASGADGHEIVSIVRKLRQAGIIERGPHHHGFVLLKAPGEISVLSVVEAVQDPVVPSAPCGGDMAACSTRGCCVLAPLCRAADEAFHGALRSFTMAELMDVPVDTANCLPALGRP